MRPHFKRLFAGIVLALPCCTVDRAALPPPRVQRVVLVHGFGENGTTWKMLKKRLEARGVECYVPQLFHADGRTGLGNLAKHLKQDIDAKFGVNTPVSIVAFSMGGLVSRAYLQDCGGAARCQDFITISSPHHGTKAAWLYPSRGAKDMRPGSPFLAGLRATESHLGKISVTSYRTPMDLIILPPTSSVWDRADNVEVRVMMHPLMLNSGRVLDDIERRLLDGPRENGPRPPQGGKRGQKT